MEPTRRQQATLVDLIDRILDKGILLNTDLIISLSGIPLLGINLKLALAGMETMLEYGIMVDWDEAQRSIANKEIKRTELHLDNDEYVIFAAYGTHWYSKGIYESWRGGTIYITNKRLVMFRKIPAETLLEISYEKIRAMVIKECPHYTGVMRKELHLLLVDNNEAIQMHSIDTLALKQALESILKVKGIILEENAIFTQKDKDSKNFLQPGEEIINKSNMWYMIKVENDDSTPCKWKPGHLYFTDSRLCWWYDFDKKLLVDIPTENLRHVTIQKDGGNSIVGEHPLLILYREENENKVASFSGDDTSVHQWEKVISEYIREQEDEKNTDTCPKCGKKMARDLLLMDGCSRCGWISYRLK